MPEHSTSEQTSENSPVPSSGEMSLKMKMFGNRGSRPVLIGGLGLSASLALWNGLSHGGDVSIAEDGLTTIGLCALGVGAWLWRRRTVTVPTLTVTAPTGNRQAATGAIARLGVAIARLQAEFNLAIANGQDTQATGEPTSLTGTESATSATSSATSVETLVQIQAAISEWSTECDMLTQSLDRQTLTIAVIGASRVGKSAVIQGLKTAIEAGGFGQTSQLTSMNSSIPAIAWDELTIRATRSAPEVTARSTVPHASPDPSSDLTRAPYLNHVLRADCVLYTIAGDLTASERRDLEQLDRAGQTTIVLWNKSDQVREADRDRVLGSIRHQLADLIPADRILALAAAPQGVTVPSAQSSGFQSSGFQSSGFQSSGFEPLIAAFTSTVLARAQERIWQQIQRASRLTIADIQQSLNRLRRHRAEPMVHRYQWIAAAAVAANPLPSLDLLALGSVGTQLLIDVGQIYQRDLSLDRARAGFEVIAEMLLKLGLVELSTQAIATVLKSHPVTFLAGSAAQGLSAAYLIQVIGSSAITYFETQDAESFESIQPHRAKSTHDLWDGTRFQTILTQTIASTQRTTVLQSLCDRAASHFAMVSSSP